MTQEVGGGTPGRGGHGGPGGGQGRPLLEVAEGLGITADELRAAAEAGTALGALAVEQDVDRQSLVDAAAEEVAEGDLTQAEADERAADVEERAIAALAETVGEGRGDRGPRGD